MVMYPGYHKAIGQTGEYRLVLRKTGIFRKKEVLVLQSQYTVGYFRGMSDVPSNTYKSWRDADIYGALPFKLGKED